MQQPKIGISDMAFYIPPQGIAIESIMARRTLEQPKLGRHLERAQRVTGQNALHFPQAGEDSATMAAEAAHELLSRQANNPNFDLRKLRYFAAGTETGLDHSKSLSSYVSGMLRQAGHQIPATVSSFQVQHACAGATLAAISVGSLLSSSVPAAAETGLVVASDIARYQTETTAELTQGAGAAAILLARDPDLLEIDLGTMGFASEDVDDFFRPLGSVTAQVDGRYSMECYQKALETAFADHAERSGQSPQEILHGTDLLVLHAPFARMPVEAMRKLLATHLGLSPEGADEYLAAKSFHGGLEPVSQIGNTYTASVFIVMGWLLRDLYRQLGPAMIGKRLLLASYGSGNTMVVLRATVAARAPAVIEAWDLDAKIDVSNSGSWEDYKAWTEAGYGAATAADRSAKPSGFCLSGIREDGYRQYAWTNPDNANQETIKDLAISRA